MSKFNYPQTNFTAGEISPKMKGRWDVARYANGAETMENMVPVVTGGADRRDGLRYLATTKFNGARRVRDIPFVSSKSLSFILEFGHGYIRFYDSTGAVILNSGLTPLEIASPYTEAQLFQIKRTQSADTMFLFHPDVPTQRLRRISAQVWSIQPVPWVTQPFDELGYIPNATLSMSALTVGVGRTFTSSDAVVPVAPVIGTPTALNGAVSVAFTPPATDGGVPILFYTATSNPGGITGTNTTSPVRVNGLTNGTPYTFTVTATNAIGTSPASAASIVATPSAALPSSPVSASATPVDYYEEVNNAVGVNFVTINGPTTSAAGGYTPYTYAWVKMTGDAEIVITSANTPQVVFKSQGRNRSRYAAFRCTVTDASGATAIADVNITIKHGDPL